MEPASDSLTDNPKLDLTDSPRKQGSQTLVRSGSINDGVRTPNLARQKSLSQCSHRDPTMKAVFVMGPEKPLLVSEIVIPKPASGEVLIKIEAASIHPSDIAYIRGNYTHLHPPFQIGLEGAGTVISSGGGLVAGSLVGKRVSFGASHAHPGSWAQYIVTNAKNCFTLDDNVTIEQGACGIINPFTAVAFVETIKKSKYKAIVLTAAASQLGRMIIKLLKKEGIKVISIVRKDEQKKIVEELGSDVVINSEDQGFEEELKKKAEEMKAGCLLECICGEKTHKIMRAMPRDAVCKVFGHLEKEELTAIDFTDLLINNKTIKSFTFTTWLEAQGIFSKLSAVRKVHKLLMGDLKTEIAKVFSMEEINEAFQYYKQHMTEGKVIIKPNYTEPIPEEKTEEHKANE